MDSYFRSVFWFHVRKQVVRVPPPDARGSGYATAHDVRGGAFLHHKQLPAVLAPPPLEGVPVSEMKKLLFMLLLLLFSNN